MIEDPVGQGHRFVGLMAKDRFVLFNCEPLLSGNNVAFNLRYYTLDNVDQNIPMNTPNANTRYWVPSKPNKRY